MRHLFLLLLLSACCRCPDGTPKGGLADVFSGTEPVMAQGYRAGYFSTTGEYFIAQGYQAAYFNTTGGNFLAHGYNAEYSSTTGTGGSHKDIYIPGDTATAPRIVGLCIVFQDSLYCFSDHWFNASR